MYLCLSYPVIARYIFKSANVENIYFYNTTREQVQKIKCGPSVTLIWEALFRDMTPYNLAENY
jgi:hypothetical protein